MRIKKYKGNKKTTFTTLKSLQVIKKGSYNSWKTKKIGEIYSDEPYLLSISQTSRVLYLSLSNLAGHLYFWTSTGRRGYSGRDRLEKTIVQTHIRNFFRRVRKKRIKILFLKCKNFKRLRWLDRFVLRGFLAPKRLQILGLTVESQFLFNGCRGRKRRRK